LEAISFAQWKNQYGAVSPSRCWDAGLPLWTKPWPRTCSNQAPHLPKDTKNNSDGTCFRSPLSWAT
jgi:hypothetical protein